MTLRRRRWRAALVAATLAAAAATPLPAAGGDAFSDVGEGDVHEPATKALADQGVFTDTECGDGLFCPDDPIDRWVMAVWLVRVLGGEVTDTATSRFDDVDASDWWSTYAEELANRNITTGCKTDPLRFCPDDSVTRAQMATFFVHAFDLEIASPAGFTDTDGNVHAPNIDALAAAGITTGCGTEPLRYCPDQPVTRAQMATFLHRALLKQEEHTPEPEPVEVSDDVPDVDLVDISTSETVNFRSFVTGDTPLLLWFLSPF